MAKRTLKTKVKDSKDWMVHRDNRPKAIALGTLGLILFFTFLYLVYIFFIPNAKDKGEPQYLLIYDNYTIDSVANKLVSQDLIKNIGSFRNASAILGYDDSEVKKGRYKVSPNMTNLFLIKTLKSGSQTPSKVTLHNVRTLEELCGKLGGYLITDSASYYRLLTDTAYLNSIGFTPDNVMTIFMPNTYDMYWDTPPEKVIDKFLAERNRFWTPQKKHKADSLNFSIEQIYILASIVDKESNKEDERPDIAGVYINRLRQNMPLQADPTVVFAVRDFTLTRVMEKHITFPSPYNTYMHTGLPPGPICMPEISSINAVLNATPHNYLFFCAKPDLTGYHVFAETFEGHLQNAKAYREFLDKNGY